MTMSSKKTKLGSYKVKSNKFCIKNYTKLLSKKKTRAHTFVTSPSIDLTIHGAPTANIIEANNTVDLMKLEAFSSGHQLCLPDNRKFVVECRWSSAVDHSTIIWALGLCTRYTKQMYNDSSIGWDSERKYKEMTDSAARYLILREVYSDELVAFSHFRFDMDYEEEVIYCYELHVESEVQGLGLGKFLLTNLELLASSYRMKKVILTVFKANTGALQFYKKCGYSLDATNPEESPTEKFDYVILSKYVSGRNNR